MRLDSRHKVFLITITILAAYAGWIRLVWPFLSGSLVVWPFAIAGFAFFSVHHSHRGIFDRTIAVLAGLIVVSFVFFLRLRVFDGAIACACLYCIWGVKYARSRKWDLTQIEWRSCFALATLISLLFWIAATIVMKPGARFRTSAPAVEGISLSMLVLSLTIAIVVMVSAMLFQAVVSTFRQKKTASTSLLWQKTISSWCFSAGFLVMLLIQTVSPIGQRIPYFTYYEESFIVLNLAGWLIFFVALPLLVVHKGATGRGVRRLVYGGLCGILLTAVSWIGFPKEMDSQWLNVWYGVLEQLRGDHIPKKVDVAVVGFNEGWPEREEILGLVNILSRSEPLAIVFPQVDEQRIGIAHGMLDSSRQKTAMKSVLVLSGDSLRKIMLSPKKSMEDVVLSQNLTPLPREGESFRDVIPIAYKPIAGRLVDIGVATAYLAKQIEEDRALEGRTEDDSIWSVLSPDAEHRWTLVDRYHSSTPHLGKWYSLVLLFKSRAPGVYVAFGASAILDLQKRKMESLNIDKQDSIGLLKGKVVFVTPLKTRNILDKGFGTPEVSVPADVEAYLSIVQNILLREHVGIVSLPWLLLCSLIFFLLAGFMFHLLDPWKALGGAILLASGAMFFCVVLYIGFHLFVNPFTIAIFSLGAIACFFPYEIVSERRAIFEEQSRLKAELRAAHDMQMGLMPTSDPSVGGFDISGECRPAEEVGGDYFDYVWLNEEKTRLGIAIADVSGKAMKAAMTAVMTSGMVYRELGSNETPKTILRKINRPMYFKTDKRIFTAMSFAVIDTVTKSLAFSNAGQMQPLLKRNGKIESLKVEGARLPLGMAEDVEYNELTRSLQSSDTLIFYTDGIPEAMNAKNDMFGFERLETIVKESAGDLSAKQVAAKIVEKVAEFAGSAKQHDDMTVVVVKVL